jgi:esterase
MVTNLDENQELSKPEEGAEQVLHAVVTGEGPPVVLLHGLFGMGSNLGAVARALADGFQVHQLDLPNHGRSSWQSTMDLASLTRAIACYIDVNVTDSAYVLGHSLGGKVAMQLALTRPALVRALVVADIAPVAYPGTHDAVFAAIAAVTAAAPASRAAAGLVMREYIEEPGVVQFLLLSLQRGPKGDYVWRFNAQGLREGYDSLRAAPTGVAYAGPALFVYGVESVYVDAVGMAAASRLFSQARFTGIEGTGHWLHAEKPGEFNAEVKKFLSACVSAKRVAR